MDHETGGAVPGEQVGVEDEPVDQQTEPERGETQEQALALECGEPGDEAGQHGDTRADQHPDDHRDVQAVDGPGSEIGAETGHRHLPEGDVAGEPGDAHDRGEDHQQADHLLRVRHVDVAQERGQRDRRRADRQDADHGAGTQAAPPADVRGNDALSGWHRLAELVELAVPEQRDEQEHDGPVADELVVVVRERAVRSERVKAVEQVVRRTEQQQTRCDRDRKAREAGDDGDPDHLDAEEDDANRLEHRVATGEQDARERRESATDGPRDHRDAIGVDGRQLRELTAVDDRLDLGSEERESQQDVERGADEHHRREEGELLRVERDRTDLKAVLRPQAGDGLLAVSPDLCAPDDVDQPEEQHEHAEVGNELLRGAGAAALQRSKDEAFEQHTDAGPDDEQDEGRGDPERDAPDAVHLPQHVGREQSDREVGEVEHARGLVCEHDAGATDGVHRSGEDAGEDDLRVVHW